MSKAQLINRSDLPKEPDCNCTDEAVSPVQACALNDEEKEPIQKIVKAYFTNLEGEPLEKITKEKEIYLVIETENMGGEEVIINLPEHYGDFKYEGELITEDKVIKLSVGSSTEKLKLEVVPRRRKVIPRTVSDEDTPEAPPIETPEDTTEKDPTIINAFWSDESKAKTTRIKYGEKARIKINTSDAKGKTMKVKIYESDTGPDDFIHEYSFPVAYDETEYSFNLTKGMFAKGGEQDAEFYFTLQLDGKSKKTFCDRKDEYLRASVLRYIPSIMRAQSPSWDKGAALMEHWFSGSPYTWTGKAGSHSDYNNIPYNDTIISLNWVKSFPRGKASYDAITNRTNKMWVTPKAKEVIIERLIENKLLHKNSTTSFNFIKSNAQQSNKYSTQFKAIATNKSAALDGFTAALANSELKLSVAGEVIPQTTKDSNGKLVFASWKIKITKVAVYLRDSYDFIDDDDAWLSQPLGDWNPANDKVGKNPMRNGYAVNNADFREWRTQNGKGGDFLVFSNIETFTVSDSFTINEKYQVIK